MSLATGAALVALGFPLDEVIEESAVLRETTDGIAERFAALFERNVWRPFAAAGMPAERLGEVEREAEALTENDGGAARRTLSAALERLATTLLEHLSFEERELERPMAGMRSLSG